MILSKIESEQCEINSVKSKTFDRSFLPTFNHEMRIYFLDI